MSPEFGSLSSLFVHNHIRGKEGIRPVTKEDFLNLLAKQEYPPELIKAFRTVDRSLFVPTGVPMEYVYAQCSWPLQENRFDTTISEPLVVAKMTNLLSPKPGQRILEIGAGSGYQAAILKALVGPNGLVVTTEVIPDVAQLAQKNLQSAGIEGVVVITADEENIGYFEAAPYDRILSTCSLPPTANHPLFDQLAEGGKLVTPLGGFPGFFRIPNPNICALILVDKGVDGLKGKFCDDETMGFTLMTGRHGWNDSTTLQSLQLREFLEALDFPQG